MIRHFIQRYLTNVSLKQDSTFLLILQEYNTSTLRHDLPPNNSIRVETQICRCPSICKRNANDRHRFVATGKIAKGKVDRGALVGTNVGELCQNRELCQISRPSKPCNLSSLFSPFKQGTRAYSNEKIIQPVRFSSFSIVPFSSSR